MGVKNHADKEYDKWFKVKCEILTELQQYMESDAELIAKKIAIKEMTIIMMSLMLSHRGTDSEHIEDVISQAKELAKESDGVL